MAIDSAFQKFILDYGFKASAYELAAILGISQEEVELVRRTGACTKLPEGKSFSQLFNLWHGRAPEEFEWPIPQKLGKRQMYIWQDPEIALLASLVGRLGMREIAETLTARLRNITGDDSATRTQQAIQVRMQSIGLQTKDVMGGITTTLAAREIGSASMVYDAIEKKQLSTFRVGRLYVIPHAEWEEWKKSRVFPPKGYVQLSSIRESLSIKSDKLSEFARMGYIPSAVRCNPYGANIKSSMYGTWFISGKVAKQLVDDRHAGREMPWHGKPIMENLKASFNKWLERKHPASCSTCQAIWGGAGVPEGFDEYFARYPLLEHGQKRHLNRPWTPGMPLQEVADYSLQALEKVEKAIELGMLNFTEVDGIPFVARTDATRWIARKCPDGESLSSWMSVAEACKQYLFTEMEIHDFILTNQLKVKDPAAKASDKTIFVSRHQAAVLRENLGFTLETAASKAGITVARFQILVKGAEWRIKDKIPLETVKTVIKRLKSSEGYSVAEAAEALRLTEDWVEARIKDGTVKVLQAKWDSNRVYMTEAMFKRLKECIDEPTREKRLNKDWLTVTRAAIEAGVSSTTVTTWGNEGELDREETTTGWRYHREAVRARAREYWKSVRFLRADQPAWLVDEIAAAIADPSKLHNSTSEL